MKITTDEAIMMLSSIKDSGYNIVDFEEKDDGCVSFYVCINKPEPTQSQTPEA